MRLSYTALDTFKQCPQKFKFQYLDKIPAPKSKEAVFGTLIHSALKNFHDTARPLSPTEEELLSFWGQTWNPKMYYDQREEAAAFAQGVKILKDYYAKNAGQTFDIVALETPFEAPIASINNIHIITGKIDRIDKNEDGLFEVIDYKTSKNMPSQQNVEANLQLSVYHIGVANRWPSLKQENRPIKTSLYFLKHNEKLSSIKTNENLNWAQENVVKLLENIGQAQAQGKFPPQPSPLCSWCAYQKICPMWKHKFREEKIFFNDQDVQALINEYFQLKDEVDQREEKMTKLKSDFSKFMEQENMERLFSQDGYIGRQLIQRFKYDPALLRELLEPLGRWNDILKVDEAKLKKISLHLPSDLRQKIESARKLDKEYRTFKISKTGKKNLL